MHRDSRFIAVAKCYREHPRRHLKGSVVHEYGSLSTAHPALSTHPHDPDQAGSGGLVGVEELAERVDVPPEVIVLAHLPLDLLAAVEDGRVVAAAESLADPTERRLGLL